MRTTASRMHLRLRKPAALVLGAVISMAAVTAIAVEDSATASQTQAECNAFRAASQTAMSNHLMIVNTFMGSATRTMQGAVSKGNSCIGNLAMLDFDLSRLIPDFGLLGSLLNSAISKIVGGVINRACAALTDVMNKPSEIWNGIVGSMNVNDQFQNWAGGITYNLPGGSGSAGGGNWGAASPGGTVDPWADASKPGSTGNGTCTYGTNGVSCSVAGVDSAPPTVSGADIGAGYQYLVIACSGALQQQAEAGGGGGGGSPASCQQAQDYLNTYAPYLDPTAVPKLPGFNFNIPSNIGQTIGNGQNGTTGSTPPAGSSGSASNNTDFINAITGNGTSGGGNGGAATFKNTTKSDSVFNLPVRK